MREESKTGQRSILSFWLKPKAGRDKQNAAVEEAAACTSDGSGTDSSLTNNQANDVSESSKSDELEFRDTPSQPKLRVYPQTGGRRFRAEWYHNRPWLEYSKQKDAAFCFPCRIFTPSNADAAFISLGFRKWQHALDCKKGFPQHERSVAHTEAMARRFEKQERQKTGESIVKRLVTDQVENNRYYLRSIAEVIQFLVVRPKKSCCFRKPDRP